MHKNIAIVLLIFLVPLALYWGLSRDKSVATLPSLAFSGPEIIKFSSVALETFGIFVLIGLVSGALGSLFMISKYLKKEGSEFTAI